MASLFFCGIISLTDCRPFERVQCYQAIYFGIDLSVPLCSSRDDGFRLVAYCYIAEMINCLIVNHHLTNRFTTF